MNGLDSRNVWIAMAAFSVLCTSMIINAATVKPTVTVAIKWVKVTPTPPTQPTKIIVYCEDSTHGYYFWIPYSQAHYDYLVDSIEDEFDVTFGDPTFGVDYIEEGITYYEKTLTLP